MIESKNLLRGTQLLELGRFNEAVTYLQAAVTENPDDWTAKYNLAICFFNVGNYNSASQFADSLMQQTPNDPELFSLKARIAIQQDRYIESMEFIEQAIAISPYEAEYFGLKSGLLLQAKKYEPALEFVNIGLSIDPKNAYCLNLRAQILTKLDRVEEAAETIDNILYDNPEDAYSHANVGWVELENGNNKKALEHFKEALQFNPNFEYARQGMSTALKSKNFVYRLYLKYSFWIAKKSSKNQWVFIIGIYLVYRFGITLLSSTGMTYLAIPLMIAYLLFALGGWIMEPMSNTILNFDKYGKYLLDKSQKLSGYTFGGLLILSIASIIVFYFFNTDYALTIAIAFLCALLPLPRAFLLGESKGKTFAMAYGVLILVVGLLGPFFTTNLNAGIAVFALMMLYTWIGNFIESK